MKYSIRTFFRNFSMLTFYIRDSMDLFQEIKHHYPVLGTDYTAEDYLNIDLSINNDLIRGIDVVDGLQKHIQELLAKSGSKIAKGGYGEHRDFYHTSPLFDSASEKRSIHLGIDLWVDAYRPIYAPLDGQLLSCQYNNADLDYGYTVILKHSIGLLTFHTLYGHLSDRDLINEEVGAKIKQGQPIARIGDPTTNGGWAPHLHFQIIMDMQDHIGDYPGVALKSEQDFYLKNCPNPEFLTIPKL